MITLKGPYCQATTQKGTQCTRLATCKTEDRTKWVCTKHYSMDLRAHVIK